MTKKQEKLWSAAAAVLVSVLILTAALYFTDSYPAAIVGTSLISKKYWDQGVAIGKKLDPTAGQQKASDQLVKIKEEELLQTSLKINYNSPNTAEELKFYKEGKSQDYKNLIGKYFSSSEKLFVEYVVRPEVYDARLRMKYNFDFKANAIAYSRAQGILNRAKNGEPFEDLAKIQSDDKITGQLGGDLGFIARGWILPELEKAVLNAPLGQVSSNLVVSRLGYHIIYPVETAEKNGVKVWHVKHILIKTTGFDNWLDPMLNRFWVWRIK